MNNFKNFGIKTETTVFVGDKIKMERVLNKSIQVFDYKILDSTVKENTKCLHLQLEKGGEKHVLFCSGKYLMQVIDKIPKTSFPFTTTIVKDNGYYEFT